MCLCILNMTASISLLINVSRFIKEEHEVHNSERDFKGQSGKLMGGAESMGSAWRVSTKPSDLVASFLKETDHPPATNSMESTTCGRAIISSSTVAESKLCVTYTYEPMAQEERGDSL